MSPHATVYSVTTTHPAVALWLTLWLLVGIGAVFWTAMSALWFVVIEVWRAHRRGMDRLHHYNASPRLVRRGEQQ